MCGRAGRPPCHYMRVACRVHVCSPPRVDPALLGGGRNGSEVDNRLGVLALECDLVDAGEEGELGGEVLRLQHDVDVL